MPSRNYNRFGVGQFLQKPLPLPDVEWDFEAQNGILVADKWIPYIVGVFKALLRDSTWDSTSLASDDVRQSVEQILSSWRLLYDPGVEIDWKYAFLSQGESPQVEITTIGLPGLVGRYGWYTAAVHAINLSEPIEIMDITLTFEAISDNSLVGVNLYEGEITATSDDDLISVTWHDCDNNFHEWFGTGYASLADIFGDSSPHSVLNMKFQSYTDDMMLWLRAKDGIQCGAV